jgi:carboxymethylenebutenolidase
MAARTAGHAEEQARRRRLQHGGSLSQRLALAHPTAVAAVLFYGRPETDPAVLKTLAVPLQAHFGATDSTSTRADALKQGLTVAGKDAEVYVYPGAGHAFMNDEAASYHRDAARQAWAAHARIPAAPPARLMPR